MQSTTETPGSVSIGRLHCVYLAPQRHPAPRLLRQRLDSLMERKLAQVCGRLLDPALDREDPSIWLIRSLEVDVALDVGVVDDDQIAHTWSQQLTTCLLHTIARGPDSDRVLYFPDRATYVTQFVIDLAAGQAWSKWYYRSFDSLHSLPTGTAVQEALVREPELVTAVLAQLARRSRLESVLRVLSNENARRIYDSWSTKHAARHDLHRAAEAVLTAWPQAGLHTTAGLKTPPNALRLLAVSLKAGDVVGDLRPAIGSFLGFAEILARVPDREGLVAHLAAGELRAATDLARRSGMRVHLESLAFIAQLALAGDKGSSQRRPTGTTSARPVRRRPAAGDWIARVAHTVGPHASHPGPAPGAEPAAESSFSMPFGGAFLLLPALLELGLPDLIQAALPPETADEAAVRLLLLVKCLGRDRAVAALQEPTLRQIAGLTAAPALQALSDTMAALAPATTLRLRSQLVQQLAARRRVEGLCLAATLVRTEPATAPTLLLRDTTDDAWVLAEHVAKDGSDIPAALEQGLATVRQATDNALACLLIEPDLGRCVVPPPRLDPKARLVFLDDGQRSGMTGLQPLRVGDAEAATVWSSDSKPLPEPARTRLAQFLGRAKPAAQDLAYLTLADLHAGFPVDPGSDLTWSLVAHAALKGFARRLPGFGWSSSKYLYANFLAGTSYVRLSANQLDVQLPHVPLHLVLRMAGVNGQTYTLPWLDDLQVSLSLPPG